MGYRSSQLILLFVMFAPFKYLFISLLSRYLQTSLASYNIFNLTYWLIYSFIYFTFWNFFPFFNTLLKTVVRGHSIGHIVDLNKGSVWGNVHND